MVYPFLHGTLHSNFFKPVNIVGSGLVVGRTCNQFIHLLLREIGFHINAVDLHPGDEFGVINHIFLESIAGFVHEVNMHIGVVGVDLATTFVDGHEHRFDTA